MVLGVVAREYLREWRIPGECLPRDIQQEWRDLQLDSAPARARWVKSLVRRALCEDPPAEHGLPPRNAGLHRGQVGAQGHSGGQEQQAEPEPLGLASY